MDCVTDAMIDKRGTREDLLSERMRMKKAILKDEDMII